MAAKAELVVKATGVNATGGMFREIRGNIGKVASSAATVVKGVGAVGAAVIGAGFAAFKALSSVTSGMNDVANAAHRAGEGSAASFQRLADTLGVAGLKVSTDSLVSAFQRMRKETGKTGITGFVETLDEISKLGTEEERITELTRVFGRAAGPEFAGLVASGVGNLGTLIADAMGAVSAATDDSYNKAQALQAGFDIVGTSIRTGWQEAVLAMVDMSDASSEDIMEMAIKVGGTVKYAIKISLKYLKNAISVAWDSAKWLSKWMLKAIYSVVEGISWAVKKAASGLGHLWGWLKGEDPSEVGANWAQAIEDSFVGRMGDFAAGQKAELDEIYGDLFNQDWEIPPQVKEEYNRTKQEAKKQAAAMNALSNAVQAGNSTFDASSIGTSIGTSAAEKFKDEMKNPGWIEAGSNELAKILNGPKATLKASGAAAVSANTASKLPSEISREKQVSSVLDRVNKFLEQLVEVQKGGWTAFGRFSERLEAV